jgi:hypothetical protein
MKLTLTVSFAVLACIVQDAAAAPETLRIPLSGKGPSDAVEWDFQVSAGRRAGERAKIPVPSHWEQHGFGNYDYGTVPAEEKHQEDGLYQREFEVPEAWRGMQVRIVFEAAMTDTSVRVNGESAGPLHQGGFYQFHHEITDKIRFGGVNQLEVLVSKDSANALLEQAERSADYWVFGGIYRPVWLEARPPQSIEWTAVDARADGSLRAKVYPAGNGAADRVRAQVMTRAGERVGEAFESRLDGLGPVELEAKLPNVLAWSAEEPNLYQIEFCLMRGSEILHQTRERIGFRTLEVRAGEGVFVNGRRIMVKGVNRHCFRPKSGRALDTQDSIDDLHLIKSMNMNSVRCSHYPPDKAFLDACDEIGLYVENEICTWQKPTLDTATARRVIGQMIRRDVNHPSILWWANGNEGGWNTEVDGDFAIWDIQQRPVLHPWEEFSGFQTKHYPTWQRFQEDLAGPHLVMPTEFLHGLYDGGHGAGLEDFWNEMTTRPNAVGGFLWVLADEGIERTDRGGAIDNWGINAPDGIVGPAHEKEASFRTIQDIFSPVQIGMRKLPLDFDGSIAISNTYQFRNLATCKFRWKLTRFGSETPTGRGGDLPSPAITPGATGELKIPLPSDWRSADALELSAMDREGKELWTWSWATRGAGVAAEESRILDAGGHVAVEESAGHWRMTAAGKEFLVDRASGRLLEVRASGKVFPLRNGPYLVGMDAMPGLSLPEGTEVTASGSEVGRKPEDSIDGSVASRWSQEGRDAWIQLDFKRAREMDQFEIAWQHVAARRAKWRLEVSLDGVRWDEVLQGESQSKESSVDVRNFPLRELRFARLWCLGNDKNAWNSILEWKLGRREAIPVEVTLSHEDSGACRIATRSPGPFEAFAWTIQPDGRLDLEYAYEILHPVLFHGVTFDHSEEEIQNFTWTGQGPERVWANRMRGTRYGHFSYDFRKLRPGVDYNYPHSAGYYAGIHEASLRGPAGQLHVTCAQEDTFIRLGKNDEGEKIVTAWPKGDFSLLHAIPGIGNKFHAPELVSPQSRSHAAPGKVRGKATFQFSP